MGNNYFNPLRAKLFHQLTRRVAVGDDHINYIQAAQGQHGLAAEFRVVETEDHALRGVDHGALYLERHRLPDVMVRTARYHHKPEKADHHQQVIASVQIADLLLRSEKIGCSGNYVPVTREQCLAASGWAVLFPNAQEAEQAIARASLHRSLERLPSVLEGLV